MSKIVPSFDDRFSLWKQLWESVNLNDRVVVIGHSGDSRALCYVRHDLVQRYHKRGIDLGHPEVTARHVLMQSDFEGLGTSTDRRNLNNFYYMGSRNYPKCDVRRCRHYVRFNLKELPARDDSAVQFFTDDSGQMRLFTNNKFGESSLQEDLLMIRNHLLESAPVRRYFLNWFSDPAKAA